MRILSISAFPQDEEGLARRRAKVPHGILEGETEYVFVGVRDAGVLLMDSYYNLTLHEPFLVEAGLKAEDEGFDAVVVDSVSDIAVNALRSRLAIPVVGPGQAAYATASMLGRRFSLVTRWQQWDFLHDASLDAYGLRARCASVRAPKLPQGLVDELPGRTAAGAAGVLEARDDYWEAFVEAGRAAVEVDGADVLIVASMTMQRAAEVLREHLPAPVIDPGPLALVIAESLVRLGLTHSKRTWYEPTLLHDDAYFDLLG